MKGKNFSGGADLTRMAAANPQLSALLSQLSAADMEKLQQVLSDPAQARSILATPQAQAMLHSLQGGRRMDVQGQTGGGRDAEH